MTQTIKNQATKEFNRELQESLKSEALECLQALAKPHFKFKYREGFPLCTKKQTRYVETHTSTPIRIEKDPDTEIFLVFAL